MFWFKNYFFRIFFPFQCCEFRKSTMSRISKASLGNWYLFHVRRVYLKRRCVNWKLRLWIRSLLPIPGFQMWVQHQRKLLIRHQWRVSKHFSIHLKLRLQSAKSATHYLPITSRFLGFWLGKIRGSLSWWVDNWWTDPKRSKTALRSTGRSACLRRNWSI